MIAKTNNFADWRQCSLFSCRFESFNRSKSAFSAELQTNSRLKETYGVSTYRKVNFFRSRWKRANHPCFKTSLFKDRKKFSVSWMAGLITYAPGNRCADLVRNRTALRFFHGLISTCLPSSYTGIFRLKLNLSSQKTSPTKNFRQ